MIVDCQGNTKRGVVIATVLMTLSVICFTGSYLANSEFHDDWVERDGVVSVVTTAQLGNKAYLVLRNSSTALECVTPSECTVLEPGDHVTFLRRYAPLINTIKYVKKE